MPDPKITALITKLLADEAELKTLHASFATKRAEVRAARERIGHAIAKRHDGEVPARFKIAGGSTIYAMDPVLRVVSGETPEVPDIPVPERRKPERPNRPQ